MSETELELRKLILLHYNIDNELYSGYLKALDDHNQDEINRIKNIRFQLSVTISAIYNTMKTLGLLDEKEIQLGEVKNYLI